MIDRPRAASLHTVTVTCLTDGLANHVTDVQFADGRDRAGSYQAVCGHVVLPGSLVEPEGRACPLCTAISDPPPRSRRRR